MAAPRISDILEAIRSLAREDQARLVEQLRRELDEGDPSDAGMDGRDAIIGLFATDPELIDTVCESAMQSREHDRLRLRDG
jgi:hypothetical protein